jgi:hypothetical protein
VPDWPLPALAEPYWASTPVGAAAACGGAGRATTTGGVMMLAEDEGRCTATVVPLLSAW